LDENVDTKRPSLFEVKPELPAKKSYKPTHEQSYLNIIGLIYRKIVRKPPYISLDNNFMYIRFSLESNEDLLKPSL
jgi:hypothetical protein